MWKDPRLKKICDIEADEPPYGIAVLSPALKLLSPNLRVVHNTQTHAIFTLIEQRETLLKWARLPKEAWKTY